MVINTTKTMDEKTKMKNFTQVKADIKARIKRLKRRQAAMDKKLQEDLKPLNQRIAELDRQKVQIELDTKRKLAEIDRAGKLARNVVLGVGAGALGVYAAHRIYKASQRHKKNKRSSRG